MLTVIGCGNLNRSDDGVGVRVAKRLRERLDRHPVPGVRAFDCGTAGMEVMFAARGSDALLIVDAAVTGAEPGTIYDVPGAELEALPEPSLSLHDFRWQHALGAGRKIFREAMPEDVRVWLIEAKSVELGLELSPEVAAAEDQVFERLLAAVAEYAARRHETLFDSEVDATVRIRRGFLQVPKTLYDRAFDRREGAVVTVRDGALHLMPVEQTAGGVLVKLRNAAGDRSIDVTEALRLLDWNEAGEIECALAWDEALGTLACTLVEAALPEARDEGRGEGERDAHPR